MKMRTILLGLVIVFTSLFAAAQNPPGYEKNWHQWRGPFMTGASPDGDPASEWSETKNVKWKLEIPGKGHSTPIIWGDQLFIQTAVDTGKPGQTGSQASSAQQGRGMPSSRSNMIHEYVVLSVDRRSGKILWQRTVKEEVPQEGTHEFGSWASNSPITDGEHLYAYFGSRGLYCLDMKGNLVWERDFGQMNKRMDFGEGSSPTLYGEKIVVTWDHEGQSFIVALDKKTGKDIWKVDRDEATSWATPYVVEVGGKPQVVTSATKLIRSYDLASGELIWECGGMTQNAIPQPFAADGILYVMTGYRGNALLAIRLAEAKGNITGTDTIIWSRDRDTSYAPSALLMDGLYYFLQANNGILNCVDAKTGKEIYSGQRLEGTGNLFASPFGARDRIYVTGQQGTFYVVKSGPEFQILAKNTLDDNFNASPVAIGKQLYLRGYKNLYCIEEK